MGQSELDVARMADSTVLVLVPESGDGIQTLKSGVMEIADIFVVNKADRMGADKLRQEIEVTLGIRRGNAFRNMPAHHGVDSGDRGGGETEGSTVRSRAPAGAGSAGERCPRAPLTLGITPLSSPPLLKEKVSLSSLKPWMHHQWLTDSGELDQRRRRRLLERTREVVERATRRWIWEETRAEQLIARAAG